MGTVYSIQSVCNQVSGSLILALTGTFGLLYLTFKAVDSFRKLQHIPGPRLAAWTELWLLSATLKGNFHLTAGSLLRKYGHTQLSPVAQDLTADGANRYTRQDRSQHDRFG
jgi:hypothetical protein